MDSLNDGLKKILQAGIGAVATGVEKTQEMIDSLSQKGEPLYEQAKSAVTDAAEKIKKAVDDSGIGEAFSGHSKVQTLIGGLRQLTQEELTQVRIALEEMLATPEKEAQPQEEKPADKADGETDNETDTETDCGNGNG